MTPVPPSLQALVDALGALPGVGPKSAARMAHQLLQHDRVAADRLARALDQALARLRPCASCAGLSETEVCPTCGDPLRDASILCVVESSADQLAIEQTRTFRGLYFILQGRLSPLDGVGPGELGFERLIRRIEAGSVEEVILATSFTSEGEATAHYLGTVIASLGRRVTRLARGVPLGGELEHLDLGTIAHALLERRSPMQADAPLGARTSAER